MCCLIKLQFFIIIIINFIIFFTGFYSFLDTIVQTKIEVKKVPDLKIFWGGSYF